MKSQRTREILQKVRQVELKTRRLVDDQLAGQYHSVFKGSGMNFAEVREYVRGDEIRAIDWNVTARTGQPHVKTFTEERELTLMLVIDMSASGDFGSVSESKRELAAEVGSVLAFSATRNCDKVGLVLFTDRVELYLPPAKGRAHVLRIIREILFFEPKGRGTDLGGALDFANRVLKRRALAFVVSDFLMPGDLDEQVGVLRRKLTVTGRRHDVVAVSVNDPCEFELPDVGIITLEDAETGEQIEVDTGRDGIRRGFREEADRRWTALTRCVCGCGVDHLQLSTARPYLPALLSFFGSRRARRAS